MLRLSSTSIALRVVPASTRRDIAEVRSEGPSALGGVLAASPRFGLATLALARCERGRRSEQQKRCALARLDCSSPLSAGASAVAAVVRVLRRRSTSECVRRSCTSRRVRTRRDVCSRDVDDVAGGASSKCWASRLCGVRLCTSPSPLSGASCVDMLARAHGRRHTLRARAAR